MWENYSTDQNNFTGYMFNIKLEEKGGGGRGAFGKTCFLNAGEIVKLLLSNFGRVYFYKSFELF